MIDFGFQDMFTSKINKIWEMVDKIKVEDKNLLIIELFPKLKIVYLLPFLLNLPFLKF